MLQRLVDGDPLGRVQHEDLVQHVLQLQDLLALVLRETLLPDHVRQQVLLRVNGADDGDFLLWLQGDTEQADRERNREKKRREKARGEAVGI